MEPVPANCAVNLVTGEVDYNDIYTATPRLYWQFDHWVNCAFDGFSVEFENTCSFTVPAAAVRALWGETVPPLVAVFTPIGGDTPSYSQNFEGLDAANPDALGTLGGDDYQVFAAVYDNSNTAFQYFYGPFTALNSSAVSHLVKR